MAAPAPQAQPPRRPWLLHPAVKPAVFVLALLPLVALLGRAFTDALGANPAEAVILATGEWTLRLLCATLAITPLRRWLQQPALARLRRMLGLFTFFYGSLHLAAYAWLDQGWDLGAITADIAKRPFILFGFAGFVLMLPLAATSFNRAIRALGGARWQALHRVVYAVAVLGLLHYFWMRAAKMRFAEVMPYAALIAVLLAARLHWWRAGRPAGAPRRA